MTTLADQREVINLEILRAGFRHNPRARGTFIFERMNGDKLKIDTRGNNLKMVKAWRSNGETLTITLVSKPLSKINPAAVVPYLRRYM